MDYGLPMLICTVIQTICMIAQSLAYRTGAVLD